MPPPVPAELPDRVLSLTVTVPLLAMPPPLYMPAELPDRVLLLTVSLPSLKMAPPPEMGNPVAELPDRVLLLTVSVPPVYKYRPPPRTRPTWPKPSPPGPPFAWLEAMVLVEIVRALPFT